MRRMLVVLLPLLAACASLPAERGYSEATTEVSTRIGHAPPSDLLSLEPTRPAVPEGEIGIGQALDLALRHNPELRREYAALGISRAELEAATRVHNPVFSIARLGIESGTEIARSVALAFTDLLTMPDRRSMAELGQQRAEAEVAQAILKMAHQVEQAWYELISAEQHAALAQLIRQANRQRAELADRMVTAGTLPASHAAEYRATAAETAIAATRAEAERLEARLELANLLVLPIEANWSVPMHLPEPKAVQFSDEELLAQARAERLDLKALDRAVAEHERSLASVKRWRFVGDVELEYEHEQADGEADKQGPGLTLALPIFDQGQAELERAKAALAGARAERDAAWYALGNELYAARAGLHSAAEVARVYQRVLLPSQERVVDGHQQELNFMLKGPFELLSVRAEQYAAHGEYLEAVRDYWLARAQLRMLAGGRLPDAPLYEAGQPEVGIDQFLPKAGAPDPHAHH
ncbi:MAG: TolC family protein [Ahniella sp.]|nr:TolC family protein [Ahniella sp.]